MTPVLGPVEARLVLDLAGLPGLRIEHTLTRRVLTAIPAAHEHYRPLGFVQLAVNHTIHRSTRATEQALCAALLECRTALLT